MQITKLAARKMDSYNISYELLRKALKNSKISKAPRGGKMYIVKKDVEDNRISGLHIIMKEQTIITLFKNRKMSMLFSFIIWC